MLVGSMGEGGRTRMKTGTESGPIPHSLTKGRRENRKYGHRQEYTVCGMGTGKNENKEVKQKEIMKTNKNYIKVRVFWDVVPCSHEYTVLQPRRL
jgi:hypothetical protein